MADICPRCGLPLEICACEALVKQEVQRIKIFTTQMKYGKYATVVEGVGSNDMEKTAKELKRRLACGGTTKGKQIILQGNHKPRVKQMLTGLGYNEKSIDVI